MNPEQSDRWRSEALDYVFEAMAQSESLTEWLVYKGARVLNRRLGADQRQSLDIDSNVALEFAEGRTRVEQGQQLEGEIRRSLNNYFEEQDPVRYEVASVRAKYKPHPARLHPHGWDAIEVVISLTDLANAAVKGLPRLTIDVAAPEALREGSTGLLPVGDAEVVAYTLQRLAGEKLRAFLSSLPTYRRKVTKPGEAVRAKDVYDLARIHRAYPLDDEQLWQEIGREFRLACSSRYIDCEGIATFEEDLDVTRATYEADLTVPSSQISFDDAWKVVREVVQAFTAWNILPFTFPVPAPAE